MEGPDGNKVAVVLQLQRLGIKGSAFGVVNYQPLYDGALSITFSSDTNKVNFEKEIVSKGANIQLPNLTVVPYEARIHRISKDVDREFIQEEITRQVGIAPVKVEKFPYKDLKYQNQCFAVVTCTSELYFSLRRIGRINIGWEKHRVDTMPLPLKCKNCGLLGHTSKRCAENSIPLAIKNKVVPSATAAANANVPLECADCLAQNHLNKKDPRYVNRPTDHRPLSLECKTYIKMCRRKLKFLGDVPTLTQVQPSQIQATPLTSENLDRHNRLNNSSIAGTSGNIQDNGFPMECQESRVDNV